MCSICGAHKRCHRSTSKLCHNVQSITPVRSLTVWLNDALTRPGWQGRCKTQTRALLDALGLEFEQACIDFDKNPSASGTASSIQVRQKIHTGSVQRWKRYEKQLQPLREMLEVAGIAVE